MKQMKLSVIIPVYNVEQYLKNCLDSIAEQTFQDMEVIIVNDGSEDNSLDILRDYDAKYEHFQLIDQENKGMSAARNVALNNAKGDYIGFLDSDDFFDIKMYAHLIEIAEETKADIIKCGILYFDDSSKNILEVRTDFDEFTELDSTKEILDQYLIRNISRVVWNGIYKHALFENVRFPEGRKYNDNYVTPQILANANSLIYTPEIFCYYRRWSGASTLTSQAHDMANKLKSLNKLYNVIVQRDLQDELSKSFAYFFFRLLTEYHNSLIYSDPLALRKNRYAAVKLLDNETIHYVDNYGNLNLLHNKAIQIITKSHYLYFIFQKSLRLLEWISPRFQYMKSTPKIYNLDKVTERNERLVSRYA
jgi:glycosyltransferase involved in cell wall biosynthesis